MLSRSATKVVASFSGAALLGAALVACGSSNGSSGSSSGSTTISLLAGGNDPASTKFANDMVAAF